jgi:hypothetical protein
MERSTMTRSRRSIAALLIAVAALAGCTSDPVPARPVAAAATAKPSPAPTPLTKAQAAKIYLDAVTPVNNAVTKLNVALKTGNLKRIRARAKISAKANQEFLATLTDTLWPTGVQRHADKLAESVARDQGAYTALSQARSQSAVEEAAAGISSDASQAQLMRVKLGLGAVPAT